MTIREWALKIARILVFMMYAAVPIHWYVGWQGSDVIAHLAFILLCVVTVLSIVALRFKPFVFALVAMLLHMGFAH